MPRKYTKRQNPKEDVVLQGEKVVVAIPEPMPAISAKQLARLNWFSRIADEIVAKFNELPSGKDNPWRAIGYDPTFLIGRNGESVTITMSVAEAILGYELNPPAR